MTEARVSNLVFGGLALAGLFAPFVLPGFLAQMTELWLFIIFALTWDLVGGQMGYNSFGNVVFIGIGVYTAVVVQISLFYDVGEYTAARGGGTDFTFDTPQYLEGLALGIPAGGILAALAAIALGAAVLGMRGQYFAICTLGLGIAAGEVAGGWDWIGAGSGMTTPQPPFEFETGILLYYIAAGLAVVTFIVISWVLRSRFGLAINAIRDDEEKAEAIGHYTTRIKVTAWTIAAFFLGLAGGVYGNLKRFVDPNDVAFAGATVGVWMILMAILGGKGTLLGPIIGAIIFQFTKEFFWTFLLGWQRVALGVLIVAIVVYFPQGIVGWLKARRREEVGVAVAESETARSEAR